MTLQLPQLAHIPGVTVRYFRGEVDYPILIAIQQARAEIDQIDPRSSYESMPTLTSIATEYAAAELFAPRANTLVVEVNGRGIASTFVEWWQEQDGTWLYLHEEFVVPQWRNQGIEQALLAWTEERLRHVAATHPTNGKAVLGANATSAEPDRQKLLQAVGYQEVFSMLEMQLSTLQHLSMPASLDGFRITNAQRSDYRLLWDAMQEAYHGRAMFQVFSEEDCQAFIDDPTHDPDFEFVAWDRDTVAGMVFVRVDGDQGIVDECNVRPAYRRRGLATALLIRGLTRLREQDVTSARLHVRKQNETRAQQVYERLGFQERKEFLRYRKLMPI